MRFNLKILFLVFLLLIAACKYVFAGGAPEPVRSEYFLTKIAGLTLDLKQKEIKYILGLQILKPFPAKSFVEVSFDNPSDPQKPLITNAFVDPQDKELLVYSPAVQNSEKGKYYKIEARVFTNEKKRDLIAEHTQKILSAVDKGSLDTWLSLNGMMRWNNDAHKLELFYPDKWYVKEMSNGNNFQAFFSLENIDQTGYYSTGIMLIRHINPALQDEGMYVNHNIVNSSLANIKNLISEERKEVTTECGYKGVVSKINFVNAKGVEEKELLAIFSHNRRLAFLLCEAPSDTFDKYEKIFYSIILTAKLY